MTGNETIVFDHIVSQADKEGKWAVSISALAGATDLSNNDVTKALKGLEDNRSIDQFTLAEVPEIILGLRIVDWK